MDINVKGYLDRAENELMLAKANFELSTDENTNIFLSTVKNLIGNIEINQKQLKEQEGISKN